MIKIPFLNGLLVLIGSVGFLQPVVAKHHTLNLIVQYKAVYFAGKTSKAITVNGKIPAPTLHFKQGDRVTINVFNHLDKETAIHWHGLILPWQMDGVLGVTQHGIPPGGVFHYQFSLQQSGTYWYHAHAGLQEQQGLYGAFLIDPTNAPSYKYTKDVVVVLSDWSNTAPEQILANLKKEGDYYSPKFPLQPSLTTFIDDYHQASNKERKKIIADYKMMQQMRMGIYDLSDVAYDAFLLNGKPHSSPWTSHVKKGDIVRLRFIGAAGSTIFNVKIPGTTMQMVHVQGNDVTPYLIDEFKIAPGETYDVLIKIQHKHPYIIYAESIDTLGAAYGALVTDTQQKVNYQEVTPFPKPLPPMRNMMSLMMGTSASSMNEKKGPSKPKINSNLNINPNMKMDPNMNMDSNMNMDPNMNMNSNMNMSMLTEANILGDKLLVYKPATAQTIGTKYQDLKAAVKTNDPTKPVYKVIKMELFGYMDRYIWFINGVPEDKAVPIRLAANKRYRFIFTNPSMMRHPMHMHGHWFILRNGHASYDPLLHTIDVPPGATVTADLDTDVSGQWLFHCHLIYHMMSGMSRIVQYDSLIEIIKNQVPPEHIIKQTAFVNRPIIRVDKEPIDRSLVHHPMPHLMGLYLANYLDLGEDPFNNSQKLTFKGLYGRNYQKLQLYINDAEVEKGKIQSADVDIFYWQLVNQFWAIKAGINYFNRPAQTPYWQPGIGIEGLMPYFIDTNLRAYYFNASFKLDAEFSRNSQITNNFFIRTGIRSILASKTVSKAAIGAGLNQMRYILRPYYRLMPGVNIFSEYEYQRAYGTFKNLEIQSNEPSVQKTITVGLAMLF